MQTPDLSQIYALTPQGEDELHGNRTRLSSTELELLVRLDGVLSLAQIKAGMPALSAEGFESTFRRLHNARLLSLVEIDPLSFQFQAGLDKLALAAGEAEADAGGLSLRRSGYYVGIVRTRRPAPVRTSGGALSAVVVEDEPTLAKFIRSYLAFEGFQVRLAGNRAEVIAAFGRLPIPDLVLLDVMLPDVDGFDILLSLRRHKILKDVPIIMLTGQTTREAVIKGIGGGADGFVTKPFEAESLMRAVRAVVGLPENPQSACGKI